MMLLLPLLLLLLLPYIVMLAWVCLAIKHSKQQQVNELTKTLSKELPKSASAEFKELETECRLSVVVCAHAEEPRVVERCVLSLAEALKPTDQIILVLDHPTDSLLRWGGAVANGGKEAILVNLRILNNKGEAGKKHAQRLGVTAVGDNGENGDCVVVSVDADCLVNKGFGDMVREHAARMLEAEESRTKGFLLLLPILMRGDSSLFGRMVEMEFVCLQAVSAGWALRGKPAMANGAGMVFTHNLYVGHNQHLTYASGDDMFLLQHAIWTQAPVGYVAEGEAVVTTGAPETLGTYLRQRVRWLSKAGGYRMPWVQVVAIIVGLAVVSGPLATVLALCGVVDWWVAIALFGGKLFADGLTYAKCRWLWGSSVPLWVALPLEVLYPLMVLTVGIRALGANKKRW